MFCFSRLVVAIGRSFSAGGRRPQPSRRRCRNLPDVLLYCLASRLGQLLQVAEQKCCRSVPGRRAVLFLELPRCMVVAPTISSELRGGKVTLLDTNRKNSRRRLRHAARAHTRLDFQGLRMVAVLTVFASHLWGWPSEDHARNCRIAETARDYASGLRSCCDRVRGGLNRAS